MTVHLVTRAVEIRAVLGDEHGFPAAPRDVKGTTTPLLTELHGDEHQRQRAMVMAGLGPEVVRSARPFITASAVALAEAVEADPRADLIAAFAVPLPRLVLGHLLDIEPHGQQQVLAWSSDGASHDAGTADGGPLDGHLRAVVARATDRDGTGIVDRMLRAPIDPPPTADEVVTQARFLTVAGVSTTTALLGDLLLSLAHDPSAQSALRRDPSRVTAAVEEALRWRAPAAMISRTAARPTAVGARTVETGDLVVLDLRAAGRDPEVYDDPSRFSVARDRRTHHVAFGAGAHVCAGAQLARVIAHEAVIAVTQRFAFCPVPSFEPRRAGSLVSGPLLDLLVDVLPH